MCVCVCVRVCEGGEKPSICVNNISREILGDMVYNLKRLGN